MIKQTVIETLEHSVQCDACGGRRLWLGQVVYGDHIYKCSDCGRAETTTHHYPQNHSRKVVEFGESVGCCRCHKELGEVSWRKVVGGKSLALCETCVAVMVPQKEARNDEQSEKTKTAEK